MTRGGGDAFAERAPDRSSGAEALRIASGQEARTSARRVRVAPPPLSCVGSGYISPLRAAPHPRRRSPTPDASGRAIQLGGDAGWSGSPDRKHLVGASCRLCPPALLDPASRSSGSFTVFREWCRSCRIPPDRPAPPEAHPRVRVDLSLTPYVDHSTTPRRQRQVIPDNFSKNLARPGSTPRLRRRRACVPCVRPLRRRSPGPRAR